MVTDLQTTLLQMAERLEHAPSHEDVWMLITECAHGLREAAAFAVSPEPWKCGANRAIDPPQECDWPLCGCDPYAEKVIAALEEIGDLPLPGKVLAVSPEPPPIDTNIRTRMLKIVAYAEQQGRSLAWLRQEIEAIA